MTAIPTQNRSQGRISSGSSERSRPRLVGSPSEGLPADANAMRAVRRRWASGVAVLTTRRLVNGEPRYRGTTITGFQVVSLDPPLIALFMDKQGTTSRLIQETGVCAVSVLDRGHEFEADRFAGMAPVPNPTFDGIPFEVAATGSPILTGALAWFDCRFQEVIPAGDHLIMLCAVERVGLGPDTDDPLMNYEGSYRRIEGAL
jgi:flavin reductase (DIM6/NTAB) family NADH-FMN oxidoreductase RutF